MQCACVSPSPGGEGDPHCKAIDKKLSKQLRHWHREEEKVVKLLLLGTGESGKSTITKQMRIIHINGFDDSERREKVRDIRKNVRDSILSIIGAMPELRISLENDQNEECVDFMMKEAIKDTFTYPQVFYDFTLRLWRDEGVQECFRRSNEYQLIDCAKYFLDRIHLVRREDYCPTDQDILRCRVMTNAIQRIDFSVKDNKYDIQFSVFDVGGQRGERRKWIQVFDSVTAILFVLDCSSYDLVLREDITKNRLMEAAEIFQQVWSHRYLRYVSIILFINKIDVLAEKIAAGNTLSKFIDGLSKHSETYRMLQPFQELQKVKDGERKEFVEAFPRSSPNAGGRRRSRTASTRTDVDEEVIRTAVFFKRLFMDFVQGPRLGRHGSDWHDSHTCEYYYTCAVDTDNIKKVLEGCRSLIIKKHLERWGISLF